MTGNVFEWVAADPTKPDPNGWGPYTVRGGSFLNQGHFDIYERNLVHHDNHAVVGRMVGFRLAAASLGPNSADFNTDSLVNGVDLEMWQQAYGISVAGDADNDGDSDGNDFLIWQRQFLSGTELPSENTSIPEPSCFLLSTVCVLSLVIHRWR